MASDFNPAGQGITLRDELGSKPLMLIAVDVTLARDVLCQCVQRPGFGLHSLTLEGTAIGHLRRRGGQVERLDLLGRVRDAAKLDLPAKRSGEGLDILGPKLPLGEARAS